MGTDALAAIELVSSPNNEDGTAARPNGRRVWCCDGYVVLRVERAWDRACDVHQHDISEGDFNACVAHCVGDEGEDVREHSAGRTLAN